MKRLIVFCLVLGICGTAWAQQDEVARWKATAEQNAQTAAKALEEVARLQAEVRRLKEEIAALKAELALVEGQPRIVVDDAVVPKPGGGEAPKADAVAPTTPPKTYLSVGAMLADVPGPSYPKPREWNDLTRSRVEDWARAMNEGATGKIPGCRLTITATIGGFEVRGDILYLWLYAPVGNTTLKGCSFPTGNVGWWVALERTGPVADQLADLKTGDTCRFSGIIAEIRLERWSYLWDYAAGGKEIVTGVGVDELNLTFEPDAELSKFARAPGAPPVRTVRRRRPEGGGTMRVGIID